MEIYGNFNRKRKGRKVIIAVICAVIVLLAVIYYIGMTVGSDSNEMQQISSAVAENIQLKEQISELNEQIERQRREIENLEEQLESRPTEAPIIEGSQPPEVSPSPLPDVQQRSPRQGVR